MIHLHELLPESRKKLRRLSYGLNCESHPPDRTMRENSGKSLQPPLTCSGQQDTLVTDCSPVTTLTCGNGKPEARSLLTVRNVHFLISWLPLGYHHLPPSSTPQFKVSHLMPK